MASIGTNATENGMPDLNFKGVVYRLGYYSDLNDAVAARKEAERIIYGEFLESLDEKENDKNE